MTGTDRLVEEGERVMNMLRILDQAYAAHVIERLLGFIESIPADRRHPWHTVTLNRTGWHLAHPVTCVLEGCPFDRAVRIWAQDWDTSPLPDGSYRWADPSQLPTETDREVDN